MQVAQSPSQICPSPGVTKAGHTSANLRAVWMLVLATACWGFSFSVMKALALEQEFLCPGISTWFVTSFSLMMRFGIAAGILILFSWKQLRSLTRLEIEQGLGLGIFAGAGMLFQIEALNYTDASTAAFLTQFYVLVIPVVVFIRQRVMPSFKVVLSSLLVLLGIGVLCKISWTQMKIGRGELETILASTIFTGQILWLERPKYQKNRMQLTSIVMFVVIVMMYLPTALYTSNHWHDFIRINSSAASIVMTLIIALFCTLAAFTLMNYWQPKVTATQAGVIYCAEPVFASIYALFLPEWLSKFGTFNYPNEVMTFHLLVGGALITLANIILQKEMNT